MIIINFKTYETGTGDKALELAKIHEEVAKETGANIQIVVQAVDIAKISQEVDIPIIAQHIDPIKYGSSTGHILPESVKMAGAVGTLINHSEKRLEREIIRKTVERAKDVGLITIICAATAEEGATFVEFNPDYIAVEPPELIGDPNISVATAKPEVIKKAVELVRPIKLLVGAGVKDGRDVKISMELGAQGVLLASAIARSKDPKALLLDLASGLG
jgi:triosephosphate isomerase